MDFPFVKEAITGLFSKSSCDMYPVVPSEAADRYRGKIVFHPETCVNCGLCEKVCSGNAITTVVEHLEEGDKITRTFNLGSCTFCATCADFCHSHSIEFTKDYHMIATKEEDLLVSGTFMKAPIKKAAPKAEAKAEPAKAAESDGKPSNDPAVCVYCTLCAKKCPMEAITVDRAEKTWTLDADKCISCGTCATVCPKKCISL